MATTLSKHIQEYENSAAPIAPVNESIDDRWKAFTARTRFQDNKIENDVAAGDYPDLSRRSCGDVREELLDFMNFGSTAPSQQRLLEAKRLYEFFTRKGCGQETAPVKANEVNAPSSISRSNA